MANESEFRAGAGAEDIAHTREVSTQHEFIAPHTSFGQDSPGPVVPDEEARHPALPFAVVAIGGSAGGIEAFTELLRNVPAETGLAYVVIQHMQADQPSLLAQLLSRATPMPVTEAVDGTRLEPDRVYIIPPGYRMTIGEGALHLKKRLAEERVSMPIDAFFRSLAADQGNRTIAIIMSGQDSDGALGMKAIKGEGGITIVQDERTAKFDSMPHSAIIVDNIDFILPPAEIGVELARIAKQFQITNPPGIEAEPATQEDRKHLHRLYALLKGVSGVDFSLYKQNTVRRRLARRMVVKKADTLTDYLQLLESNPGEIGELHEDILINYTRFFRDPETFDAIKSEILPAILNDRSPAEPIRIWVPGCSTGEEVYSLAICVLEHVGNLPYEPTIQIFGTDLSDRSVDKARYATYPDSLAVELSKERIRKFFTKVDRGYQVSKRVRDLCVFAKQNLGFDPPFSRMDIISCRNVLIYFGAALQRMVLATFHYALNPSGFLMLGNSENIRDRADIFTVVNKKHRFYQANAAVARQALAVPARRLARRVGGAAPAVETVHEAGPDMELQWAADRIVLARYGPPGVVVNENMDVLQSRGHTSPFLELQPGAASLNLLRMARDGVRLELRDALRKAIAQDVPVSVPNLRIESEGQVRDICIDVLPVAGVYPRMRRFMVLFVAQNEQIAELVRQRLKKSPDEESREDKDSRVRQLEQDLIATKLYLQSLVEERDSTNQDLVSANEEIQSRNEELQSINEELETAKEELQSTNEEVQTVNEELTNRNAELSQTGNDLRNLLNNTTLPVIMLDSHLRIRQFTNAAEKLMNLRAGDVGRPVREIRLELSVEDLEPLLIDVIDNLSTREMEVQDRNGRWYFLRARPYRTMDNRIDGVVLVLIDIHDIRQGKEDLEKARDFSQAVVESVEVPLVVLDTDCRIVMVNRALALVVGLSPEDLRGRHFCQLVNELWGMRQLRRPLEAMGKAENPEEIQIEHVVETGDFRVFLAKARMVATDGRRAILVTLEDITARKKAELLTVKERERLEGKVQITEQALGRTQEELRALAASLFTAQEEERRRVARELHDDLSQKMAMLEVEVQRLDQQLPAEAGALHEQMNLVRERAGGLSKDLRRIAHQLHPGILDDLGLSFALKALAEEFAEVHEIPVRFTSNALPDIPHGVASCIYRLTQEALRNIAKHAGQTTVRLGLNGTKEGLRLIIRDMGSGFDTRAARQKGGLGIISMQERVRLIGGRISIRSTPGNGTSINVRVPLATGTEL